MNKTKIIATVGPASKEKNILTEIIKNGVDIIRINMSYASYEFCDEIIEKVKQINKELKLNTAIMMDLMGPRITVGSLENGQAIYKQGDKIRVYGSEIIGDHTKLSTSYPKLINEIKTHEIIKLSNGIVQFEVIDKLDDYLLCEVINGGTVFEYKNINVPTTNLRIPFLREKDIKDIQYASSKDIDFLALSMVKTAEDVLKINDLLIDIGNDNIEVISKIESHYSIENIDEIIKVSDGIMVARGDLGAEIEVERVPGIQKMIINKCHNMGKISIVATEFLASMEHDVNPTRAEVSDIANAVLESVDVIMLSGETTIGKYPVETVRMMERIIKTAEKDVDHVDFINRAMRSESQSITGSISHSVAESALKLKCKAIVAPTNSGYTAKKMSKFRPNCPIIAISSDINTVKKLSIYYGVTPVLIDELKSLEKIMKISKEIAISLVQLKDGDKIIVTGGYPFKEVKHTNFMQIEEI